MNDFIEVVTDENIRMLVSIDTISQVSDCDKDGCVLYLYDNSRSLSVKTSYNDIKKQLVWEEVKDD